MNIKSFAQLVMLAIKKNDETYVVLSYQILFIKNSKKFINREVTRCNVFQIEELNMSKFLKDLAQMFF